MNGVLLSIVFHLAIVVFVAGMGWRCFTWLRAPVPLKIPLTPAPTTATGVAARLVGEALGFRALLRGDKVLWGLAWIFHLSLALLVLGHFGGLVAPEFSRRLLGLSGQEFVTVAKVAGSVIGVIAAGSLVALLVRRLAAERLRYLSQADDYFVLGLLLLIVGTGLAMRLGDHLDGRQVRALVANLFTFRSGPGAPDVFFAAHILLVSALLVYTPFGKLVHMVGLVFNPALNQPNTARDRRYVPSQRRQRSLRSDERQRVDLQPSEHR